MNKPTQWWQNASLTKKIITGIIIVILILIVVSIIKKKSAVSGLSTTVQTGNVVNSVVLSGTTQSASAVNLGFASQGRVASVTVKEGDKVHAGQVLATLDTADLQASLKNAKAALIIAKANTANSSTNLETVTAQQDTLVQNAHNTLLSDHLQAIPQQVTTMSPTPIITGTYTGAEGQYIVHTYPSGSIYGASFSVSGLETGFTQQAAPTPVPLGSHGLYIQFPTGNYGDASWTISIPNTQSPTYTSDKNIYDAAVTARAQAIATAQADSNGQSTNQSVLAAQISQAEAQVETVNAEIQQREVVAPFDGVVAAVNVKPGQTTNSFNPSGSNSDSANANISLISQSDYEVVLDTPEINVASLTVGQPVSLTLNAFGTDAIFPGIITTIDPAETIVDGVPVYETKVSFTKLDPRIRSGMTATATIIVAEKDGVLTVPVSYIHTSTSGSYVYVLSDKHTTKQTVTTGLRGSDSVYEITSGLTAGQTITADAQ